MLTPPANLLLITHRQCINPSLTFTHCQITLHHACKTFQHFVTDWFPVSDPACLWLMCLNSGKPACFLSPTCSIFGFCLLVPVFPSDNNAAVSMSPTTYLWFHCLIHSVLNLLGLAFKIIINYSWSLVCCNWLLPLPGFSLSTGQMLKH